jgi:hypothetical protein
MKNTSLENIDKPNEILFIPAFWVGGIFVLLLTITLVNTFLFGPYYSPDTVYYFQIAKGNPESLNSLSPFYPFLLSISELLPITIFDISFIFMLISYSLAIYILYLISRKTYQSPSVFLFCCLGISLLSWWSYRILGSAHADGLFYVSIMFWVYLFIYGDKKEVSFTWSLALLSALMVWIKLNSLFIIPFLVIWSLIKGNKRYWSVIMAMVISYAFYHILVPRNVLMDSLHQNGDSGPMIFQQLQLGYFNMVALGRVILGLVLSDVVSSYLPGVFSFLLALAIFALKIFFLVFAKDKIGKPTFVLLLFGTVYLVIFLVFQQWIGFKEVNSRTLFPYLLTLSWAIWIELVVRDKKGWVLLLCLFIASHTFAGHVYIWQKNDLASLSAVKKFSSSPANKEIEIILERGGYDILTDEPLKLGFEFPDAIISQIAPESIFVKGETILLSPEEKESWSNESEDALLFGDAVLILFHENSYWKTFAAENNLTAITIDGVWITYQEQLTQ